MVLITRETYWSSHSRSSLNAITTQKMASLKETATRVWIVVLSYSYNAYAYQSDSLEHLRWNLHLTLLRSIRKLLSYASEWSFLVRLTVLIFRTKFWSFRWNTHLALNTTQKIVNFSKYGHTPLKSSFLVSVTLLIIRGDINPFTTNLTKLQNYVRCFKISLYLGLTCSSSQRHLGAHTGEENFFNHLFLASVSPSVSAFFSFSLSASV